MRWEGDIYRMEKYSWYIMEKVTGRKSVEDRRRAIKTCWLLTGESKRWKLYYL